MEWGIFAFSAGFYGWRGGLVRRDIAADRHPNCDRVLDSVVAVSLAPYDGSRRCICTILQPDVTSAEIISYIGDH